MKLTDSHFALLRGLVELPAHRRVSTGGVSQGLIDLKDAGFAQIIPIGVLDVLTEITDTGRQALADAERSSGRAAFASERGAARFLGA
jgi:hypothetical protein